MARQRTIMKTTEIIEKAWKKFPETATTFEDGIPGDDANKGKRDGYIAALEEIENLPKIHGWIARDSKFDPLFGLGLCIHMYKPTREIDSWSSRTIMMHLNWGMYPDLKWEDEPIEVELILRQI